MPKENKASNVKLVTNYENGVSKKSNVSKLTISQSIKENLSLKLKYLKLKNKISKFIPMKYDVLLLPSINSFESLNEKSQASLSSSQGIEMKINLLVKIYCNITTNIILFKTREFSNIDIRFYFRQIFLKF